MDIAKYTFLVVTFLSLFFAGCRTPNFEDAPGILVGDMLSDVQFNVKYAAVEKQLPAGRKPVFVLQSLKNNTPDRIETRVKSAAKDVRILCRKSAMFDVKDDDATQMMVDRIRMSVNGGLESGDLLSAFKTHASPQYVMTGEVDKLDKRCYKFYLRLIDLSGISGDGGLIVWEDSLKVTD